MQNKSIRKGFTLLELLIVIAILGILGTVVIFLLNPVETLKKARDSQRLSDLSTMKTALGIYMSSVASPALDNGTNTNCADSTGKKIWISYYSGNVTITATTSAGSSFATLAATSTTASSTLVDGTGWLPVNLGSLTGGSPISTMPVDPINTVAAATASTTDFMYRYSCKKTPIGFEIDAQLESDYYTIGSASSTRGIDGGNNANLYEVGSDLTILPASGSF
ncbi:type II secretion system protein [Candidatus Wolfebacteria bacterium]|nr:type II secretion system protein [Candidatus Wolfebacteria bacterium]